ncbi:carbonic anhydrase [Rhizobium leguminosarum]|uniref:carbonic anhydrase n=1 Tax=Rhizobium leguminosarum TaxID=384 RepID=UPI0024A9B0BC|nr:carbonic anhydrase [Rhizobium leguminosarum]MDI5929531.1 carbonic anhydrase [Rhizobium leguminosarum]
MISNLLTRNRTWSAERTAEKADYFERLSQLQQPEYLWIGCSDSRVPANVITGLEPGEVFVHRNVANLIHPTDLNMLSVVEFAVQQLNVKHIIICGHYGCGGVRAAVGGQRFGIIDHWLQPIRDVADQLFKCIECGSWSDAELDKLCEASIIAQVERLARTPTLQSAWRDGKDVTIHGWVYGLKDGLLSDLQCSVSPTDERFEIQAPTKTDR